MVGTAVLIIGKVRAYNQEKYLSPEIIKTAHPGWLRVRSLELGLKNGPYQEKNTTEALKEEIAPKTLEQENIVGDNEALLPHQKLSHLIKELDLGSGALIEDIIEKSPLQDTEAAIQKMLEKGEIFQISPGKVKVL